MAKNYIQQMKERHEAFKNYGLDFDYDSWVAFNRECLIREIAENITIGELEEMSYFFEINGLENYQEVSGLWRYQRLIAEFKLKKMIKMGMINKLNYLKIEGCE